MSIHPTAIIDRTAQVSEDVDIGPHCFIGPSVQIAAGTVLESGVYLHGWTTVGEGCRFHPFSVIGSDPQDLKYQGEETVLCIGNNNVFREFVTINRGTAGGGQVTEIGNDNFFMAYSHVAHDSKLGNHIVMANAATLAGHVTVSDHATIGAFSSVHQFCRVGPYAFIGGYSVVTRDALPYIKTVGDRNQAKIYGINSIGLQRKGLSPESVLQLKRVYRILFRSHSNTRDALGRVREQNWSAPEVKVLLGFIESSDRGFIR
jgi:UDP-N-acetylglucosamine acyltransferase